MLPNPVSDWNRISRGKVRVARDLKVDWKTYTQDRYIFSHCTIVASVDVEDNGYYINPVCTPLVNNNGNAWSNPVLLSTFRSFVGGENYLEHVQIPELSKGKILDAVIRPVRYKNAKMGKEANVYYVDILVATERKHGKLCERIAAGELSTMSMGCFLSGTRVTMGDGTLREIQSIVEGEEVISHTGQRRRVVRPVKTHWHGDIWKIHLTGCPEPIVCTGNHKFLHLVGREECLCGCGEKLPHSRKHGRRSLMSSFIQGHKMRVMNPMVSYDESERAERQAVLDMADEAVFGWTSARNLTKGDLLCHPSSGSSSSFEVDGAARLLGLYVAEGNLVKQGGKYRSVEFSFSLSEKDTLATETRKLLADELGVSSSIYVRPNSNQCTVRTSWSDEAVEWFKSRAGHYSWGKKLSQDVMEWGENAIKSLIGGWLDGDGCLDRKNRGRIVGATVSNELASQLRLLLCRHGVYHTWRKEPASETEEDGIVVCRREAHYLTIPKGHTSEVVAWTSRWSDEDVVVEKLHHQSPSEKQVLFRIDRVECLRPISDTNEVMDVFCLEVEGDHSFVVEGAVSAENCLANFIQCSRCGSVMGDHDPNCSHIDNDLMHTFVDENGVTRITAELCGRMNRNSDGVWEGDSSSVRFIEASWVEKPAFSGAVLNHFLSEIPKSAKILEMPTHKLEQTMEDLFRMRVADTRDFWE
jgi:hypothetical protein